MKSPSKKIVKPRGLARGRRVELNFLERVQWRCPAYRPVNEVLGDLYTKVGRFEEGLAVDLTLSQTHPHDPYVWYNLACSYALTGRKDEAFQALDRACALGYRDYAWMIKDDNLDSLHTDRRFLELLLKMKT